MKVLIVFTLIAVFQGCHSATIVDLATTIGGFLTSLTQVGTKVSTTVGGMEIDVQDIIDAYLDGAAPSVIACVIPLQEELKVASQTARTNVDDCLLPAVEAAKKTIFDMSESVKIRLGGLLGIVGNLLTNILLCALSLGWAVDNIRSIPAGLLDDFVTIINTLHGLLITQVLCSNSGVTAASDKISEILVEIFACV